MQDFSKILIKIIDKKKTLVSADMTVEQKKRLYEHMARYGATQGFTYDRFFKEGFRQWEIEGVDAVKRDFLNAHDEEIRAAITNSAEGAEANTTEAEGITGNLYSMVTMYNKPGAFWAMISMVRMLRTHFKEIMSERGMGDGTVLIRFKADNWKAWERKGIKAVLQEFIAAEQKRADDDG